MTHLFYILLGVIPGLYWLWFFYRRDKNPEPLGLFFKVYVLGALMIFPTLVIMSPTTGLGIYRLTIITPIVEETLKFMVVLIVVYRHREFDEPMDGLVYAAASALGFATLENVMYMFRMHPEGMEIPMDALILPDAVKDTAWIRALATVPAHVLFGAFWGYALSVARFSGTRRPGTVIALGLLFSYIHHGLFNLIVSRGLSWLNHDGELFFTVFFLFILMGWYPFRYFEKSALNVSREDWPEAPENLSQNQPEERVDHPPEGAPEEEKA